MASLANAALCALVATAFWPLLGYAVARHLLVRPLAIGAAPVLGWAVQNAAALPVFFLIGFSATTVSAVALLSMAAACGSLLLPSRQDAPKPPAVPALGYAAAAILALAAAAAILPKFSGGGVHLAAPIFDHVKVALVDAMARQGLPPVNPVFAEFGEPGRLAYYYLLHLSAAELALPFGFGGWEADIGLTWFTALASLSLIMGLAVWLCKRPAAALWVVALAAAGSLWELIYRIARTDDLAPVLRWPIGMAGWLFQAEWAPQHVMAGSCTIAAMILLARYIELQSLAFVPVIALTIAAGFESSTLVGGVTFALACLIAVPLVIGALRPTQRLRFAGGLALIALLTLCLAAPMIFDQLAAVRARHGGAPIVLSPYAVFGDVLPPLARRILDLPGYWLIILPIELPAAFIAGTIALTALLRKPALPRPEKLALALLACLASTGLVVSWLLVSTLGDNNDLGLRAIIPSTAVLIAAVAVMAADPAYGRLRAATAALALLGLALSLPDTVGMIRGNVAGDPVPDAPTFAQTPELWAAVRRYAGPTARVANNPLFLQDLTPWPANMSWALLANRSSCFAGRDTALAFAPLPAARREAINKQFIRVFAGQGTTDDVTQMAREYGCDVVVVVPQDGAWGNDPFRADPHYRLAEDRQDRWRIYVRTSQSP